MTNEPKTRVTVTAEVSPEVEAVYKQFLPEGDASAILESIMLANASEMAARRPRSLTPAAVDMVVLRMFISEALTTDGAQHKQWYLEQIADRFHLNMPEHQPGTAP